MNLTAAELNAAIRAYLAAKKTGDIVLHINQGRVESFDFKEHGRVVAGVDPHNYVSAFVPQ